MMKKERPSLLLLRIFRYTYNVNAIILFTSPFSEKMNYLYLNDIIVYFVIRISCALIVICCQIILCNISRYVNMKKKILVTKQLLLNVSEGRRFSTTAQFYLPARNFHKGPFYFTCKFYMYFHFQDNYLRRIFNSFHIT